MKRPPISVRQIVALNRCDVPAFRHMLIENGDIDRWTIDASDEKLLIALHKVRYETRAMKIIVAVMQAVWIAAMAATLLVVCCGRVEAAVSEDVYMQPRDWAGQNKHSAQQDQILPHDRGRYIYGDSMADKWVTSHLFDRAENMGISGTTLLAVCRDLTRYPAAAHNGELLVVSAGSNDTRNIIARRWRLQDSFDAQRCILDAVKVPVIIIEIPQMFYPGSEEANHLRNSLNLNWRRLTDGRVGVKLIQWPLTAEKAPDGLHPGPAAYAEQEPRVRDAAISLGVTP